MAVFYLNDNKYVKISPEYGLSSKYYFLFALNTIMAYSNNKLIYMGIFHPQSFLLIIYLLIFYPLFYLNNSFQAAHIFPILYRVGISYTAPIISLLDPLSVFIWFFRTYTVHFLDPYCLLLILREDMVFIHLM